MMHKNIKCLDFVYLEAFLLLIDRGLTTENRCSHGSVGCAGDLFVPGEIAFLSTCRTIVATGLLFTWILFHHAKSDLYSQSKRTVLGGLFVEVFGWIASQISQLGFSLLSFQIIQKDFQQWPSGKKIQSDSLMLMKDSSREVTCFILRACQNSRQVSSRITLLIQEKKHVAAIIVIEYSQMKVIFLCINVFTQHHSSAYVMCVK
jgi:hypothetical protein